MNDSKQTIHPLLSVPVLFFSYHPTLGRPLKKSNLLQGCRIQRQGGWLGIQRDCCVDQELES